MYLLNQVILVGRLVRDVVIHKSDKNIRVATISIAVPRSFKNMEGNYDTDFIDCVAFESVALNTSQYCSKGDIVGVKGRIQSRMIESEDKKESIMEIIAEKVTFLTSKGKDGKQDDIGKEDL